MSTAAATAYNHSARSDAFSYWPKYRKAQKSSGFRANRAHRRCIKDYVLIDLADWNGDIVLEDGMFLACEDTVEMKVVARSNLSSAVLGGEGLFNTSLRGSGVACLESPVPREELIQIVLENDTVKIDGNMAIAWSGSLNFTVEKSTKSLIGSAASGEGLVNVFRGTGKILVAPVRANAFLSTPEGGNTGSMNGAGGAVGEAVGSVIGGLLGN